LGSRKDHGAEGQQRSGGEFHEGLHVPFSLRSLAGLWVRPAGQK
jgi:hypothetical protein